ncbi:H-NS histone family protein [Achromobacter aloeverae]
MNVVARNSIKRIETEIQRLQQRADALRQKRRKPVIDSIIRSMREFEITPADIAAAFGASGSGRSRGRGPASPAAAGVGGRRSPAPKYRHPDTGETWSGRGRAPRWLMAAEQSGATREQFLIG